MILSVDRITPLINKFLYLRGGILVSDIGNKIKVLMAKVGVDTHDRGAKMLCYTLRNAGMEVIYTGLHQRADMVVKTALQEDVDIIGVSHLSGSHFHHARQIIGEMEKSGLQDVLFIMGGVVPQADVPALKQLGVKEVFRANTPVKEIINYITDNVRKKYISPERK